MTALATTLLIYAASCGFVGWLTYIICDPYNHNVASDPWYRWKQVAWTAPIWPFWVMWILAIGVYDKFFRPMD